MAKGLDRLVLVINASYEACNVISAKRAFTLLCKGAAVVEDVSEHVIRSGKLVLPVPNVIRLVNYRRVPRVSRSVSRKGILLRDSYTCQYCAKKFQPKDLTLDHVMPRSRGGVNAWENLVSSCFPCNNRKGHKTPEEAGMQLLKQPRQVNIHAKHKMLQGDQRAWSKYLFV